MTEIDKCTREVASDGWVRWFVEKGRPGTTYARLHEEWRKLREGGHSEKTPKQFPAPGYGELYDVLVQAHDQAAYGKGNERHATGQPFVEQPIMKLTALYGPGFPLGQAGKKMQESLRLPREMAIRELLGAINYIAAQIIALEKED